MWVRDVNEKAATGHGKLPGPGELRGVPVVNVSPGRDFTHRSVARSGNTGALQASCPPARDPGARYRFADDGAAAGAAPPKMLAARR